ncbi:MAG: sigma-70 family RNA polymerase sigma factor [Bacteroidetes bacterium]|nr:sigma-70 family RNA polymerase sigma factor [Bacteroidota bacterium]MCB0843204.1 sigma-70 family RNA polymerase sigma factor [Bacteroidota bacterium]MCB0852660.1 sigma-70 family RNA polymerase sigma factor [Bacteroidota bacterium]
MEKALIKKTQDKDLIKGFIAGNDHYFDVLIQRYKAKVFTTIYLIVKDRCIAEDLFQDVMIKVVRMIRAGKYNEEGKFLPWVVRIARNLAIDHFRKVQRNPIQRENEDYDIFNTVQQAEGSSEEKIIREENARYIRGLIQKLPDKQREVLIMRSYADLSFKEIAAITDVSINTALGRMRYALLNLKKLAQEQEIPTGYEETVHR